MFRYLITFIFFLFTQDLNAQNCEAAFNGIGIDTCRLNKSTLKIKSNEKELEDVVEIIKLNATSDKEKVYIIYHWITGQFKYDLSRMEQIRKGKVKRDMYTKELLSKRKGVCGDFANLFNELCDSAGVPCMRVEGYTKTFRPFNPIRKKRYDHAWNVVRIDSTWYPIDVTWGVRQFTKKKLDAKKINYSFLFAKDEEFNLRHLAGDPTFQLTEEQITYKTFRWKKSRLTDIPYKTVSPDTLMNSLYQMNEKDQAFTILDHQVKYNKRSKKAAISRIIRRTILFTDKKNPANKKLTKRNYEEAIDWYKTLQEFSGQQLEGRFSRRLSRYCVVQISKLQKESDKLKK